MLLMRDFFLEIKVLLFAGAQPVNPARDAILIHKSVNASTYIRVLLLFFLAVVVFFVFARTQRHAL